jgi:uncharacterized protein YbaP (TraB family)
MSPIQSKSVENLIRPQSLILNQFSPSIQRKSFSSLRKTKSLHNVIEQENLSSSINNEQMNIIEQFLQVKFSFILLNFKSNFE